MKGTEPLCLEVMVLDRYGHSRTAPTMGYTEIENTGIRVTVQCGLALLMVYWIGHEKREMYIHRKHTEHYRRHN